MIVLALWVSVIFMTIFGAMNLAVVIAAVALVATFVVVNE